MPATVTTPKDLLAAFRAELARCNERFYAAKHRGDEPAAFYWSLQRSAAVRLLPAQGASL